MELDNNGDWYISLEDQERMLHEIEANNGNFASPPSVSSLSRCSLPPRGEGHNASVPGFIRRLQREGFSRGEIRAQFQGEYQPNQGENVEAVFDRAWDTVASTSIIERRTRPKWPETDLALQRSTLQRSKNITLANLKSPSEVATPAGSILGSIFQPHEFVCMGESVKFARTVPIVEREDFEMPLYVPSPMTAETGSNQQGETSHRCLDNTGPRRLLVIEFDKLPCADDQIRLHKHLSTFAPLVYITHSGGKSYHGGYWCEGQDEKQLRRFMDFAVRLGADRATWTRCQMIRIPNGTALDKEGKPRQEVCFLDLGKVGSADWHFGRIPVQSGAQPFPLHCLPPVAEKMALEMARVTTAQNEALAAAALIGTLSAALGAGLEVPTGGGRTLRGNLFILAIAESGTGKGENFDLATLPLKEADGSAAKQWEAAERPRIASKLAIAERRAKKLCELAASVTGTDRARKAEKDHAQAVERIAELHRMLDSIPCIRVADVTKEALAVKMQAQPGEAIASMTSEARGVFAIVKGRYSKEGGDEDFYCSAFSGDPITVDRLTRSRVRLDRPCLSLTWMMQPDAARQAFSNTALVESGMLPRFLIFDPRAEPKERFGDCPPIPQEIRDSWNQCVTTLLTIYRNRGNSPRLVRVSEDAAEVMSNFERETVRRRQRMGDLADVAAFVARWSENAWRLALVLHAATYQARAHKNPLTLQTARNAVEILRWFADQQLEILRWGRQEKLKSRVSALLAILANGSGEIPIRDLRRSHSFGEEEIRRLQSLYPSEFAIERKKGVGRPSTVVKLITDNGAL